MTELKGTIHIYFAGGYKDGVIESHQDPEVLLKFQVDKETFHVYQLREVANPDPKSQSAMRGRQATYVYTGVEYSFEEE